MGSKTEKGSGTGQALAPDPQAPAPEMGEEKTAPATDEPSVGLQGVRMKAPTGVSSIGIGDLLVMPDADGIVYVDPDTARLLMPHGFVVVEIPKA